MSIEAMKQALEALEVATTPLAKDRQEVLRARAALRQAIEQAERIQRAEEAFAAASDEMKGEQAERQEPVATLFGTLPVYDAAPPQREKQEPTGPLVNIELSRRMAAVKVNNFYGSIIKDAEKEIERLHGLVLQHTAPPQRQWVGLTEKDFSAINQSCLTKLQAATSAESILKEKNHG